MPAINSTDSDYNKENTHLYNLSIQVGLDGFSFVIKEREKGNIRRFFSNSYTRDTVNDNTLTDAVERDIRVNPELTFPYNKITIYYESQHYLLIPTDVFEKEKARQLLEIMHPLNELDEIHFHDIPSIQSTLVYTVHTEILALLTNTLPKTAQVLCTADYFFNLPLESNLKDKVLYAQVYNDYVNIAYTENGKPLLVNTYRYTNDNDFVYHLLNIIKQQEAEKQAISIIFEGKLTRLSNVYRLVNRFSEADLADITAIVAPESLTATSKSKFYSLLKS